MSDKEEAIPQTKNINSIFSDLSLEHQQQILSQTIQLFIKSGQVLIKEGEETDKLFFLKTGRLLVFSGEKAIAEIPPGESIGEIAFFTGGVRTASVIASRNCELLQIDQQAYEKLANEIPELTQSIIKSLALRLSTNNKNTPELEPKASNVVALLPAGESKLNDEFIRQLLRTNNEISESWIAIRDFELENVNELSEWILINEKNYGQLLLIASNPEKHSDLARAMTEHADKTFLVLDTDQQTPKKISALEKRVYENSLLNNTDLIILRKNNLVGINGTSQLLNGRQVHLHHHIALNHQPDIERIQRFIAGKAIGLVLCGGGAFGTAHLGMIKALKEYGYDFDIIGGTSVGSAIAALHALGHSANEAVIKLEDMFIKRKALKKYSIPFYSLIDHKHFDNEIKRVAAEVDIEDLPINYFAVATNLSRNKTHIIRKGPLWEAVRSSCSLPGVLPPFITDEGEVLIDGAVMDNTPIRILRSLKPGPNIIMNFSALKTWKVHSSYESIPRGLNLLKQSLFPKHKARKYYPSIFTILSRSMITNTEQRFSEIDKKNDIFIEAKRLPRMGMMNWKKSREQFELSYSQIKTAFTQSNTDEDKMIMLEEVARLMKQRKKL